MSFGIFAFLSRVLRGGLAPAVTVTPTVANVGKLSAKNAAIVADHAAKFATLKIDNARQSFRENFKKRALANQSRYERVAEPMGIPWQWVAAIHERESGSNFKTYLHNGDPLGVPTTHVPAGKMFYEWEPAAADALAMMRPLAQQMGINASSLDMPALMALAEFYNGLGYRNREAVSPYVYSGTNHYTGGKITVDKGPINPKVKDAQLGVVEMILTLSDPDDFAAQKQGLV